MRLRLPDGLINVACLCQSVDKVSKRALACPAKGVSMAADAKFDVSLSVQARSLWGKSDYGVGESWLPLYVHMADSAGVASRLWDSWVPRSTKGIIARAFDGDETLAQSLFVLLAAVHDIGKAITRVCLAKASVVCYICLGVISNKWLPSLLPRILSPYGPAPFLGLFCFRSLPNDFFAFPGALIRRFLTTASIIRCFITRSL